MKFIKLFAFFSAFVLIFVFVAILFLQVDDSIIPEAKNAYDEAISYKESKAYEYFIGMQSSVKEKPEDAGKLMLKHLRAVEESNNKYEACGFQFISPEQSLALFKPEKCNECDALTQLYSHPFDSTRMTKNESVLLERYTTFLALDGYHNLALARTCSPLPPYQHLVSANKLFSLINIEKAKNGQLKQVKKGLLNNISLLRKYLESANSVVGKVTYISLIASNIDLLSSLIHRYKIPFDKQIPALTASEKSFVMPMNREFSGLYALYKSMYGENEILGPKMKVPSWVSRMLFKANMTINSSFPTYAELSRHSLLSTEAFFNQLSNKVDKIEPKLSWRNRMGYVLTKIVDPGFNNEIVKVFYLDAKIALFNKTAMNIAPPETLNDLVNPLYIGTKQHKTVYYSGNKNAICFDTPTETKAVYHCLQIH